MIKHHPNCDLAIVDNLESEVEVKFFGESSSEIDGKSFISEKKMEILFISGKDRPLVTNLVGEER